MSGKVTGMRKALVALLALSPIAAHAIMDSTSAVDSGLADTAYSWVGRMGNASAVAIGSHTILTASHVGADDFVLNGTAYKMLSSTTAPRVGGSAVDLRVVQVEDELPGWYDLGAKVANKGTITMVGYGNGGVVNEDGTGYEINGFGIRHAGDNQVTKHTKVKGIGPVLLSLLDDAGEAVVAGGDSGGGWFSNGKLVGISAFNYSKDTNRASFGWEGKSYFGSGAVDLTNKSIAKWVSGQIEVGDGIGVQAVPEPGTWAVLGVGALALLRRRRN
jgi:hypothetical protein